MHTIKLGLYTFKPVRGRRRLDTTRAVSRIQRSQALQISRRLPRMPRPATRENQRENSQDVSGGTRGFAIHVRSPAKNALQYIDLNIKREEPHVQHVPNERRQGHALLQFCTQKTNKEGHCSRKRDTVSEKILHTQMRWALTCRYIPYDKMATQTACWYQLGKTS